MGSILITPTDSLTAKVDVRLFGEPGLTESLVLSKKDREPWESVRYPVFSLTFRSLFVVRLLSLLSVLNDYESPKSYRVLQPVPVSFERRRGPQGATVSQSRVPVRLVSVLLVDGRRRDERKV